jgi:hypothetical protein
MVMPRLRMAEDQRIIARDLARRLTTRGSTVLACTGSGREAVQHAGDRRPELTGTLVKAGVAAASHGPGPSAPYHMEYTVIKAVSRAARRGL